jgi:hypothetical protein
VVHSNAKSDFATLEDRAAVVAFLAKKTYFHGIEVWTTSSITTNDNNVEPPFSLDEQNIFDVMGHQNHTKFY